MEIGSANSTYAHDTTVNRCCRRCRLARSIGDAFAVDPDYIYARLYAGETDGFSFFFSRFFSFLFLARATRGSASWVCMEAAGYRRQAGVGEGKAEEGEGSVRCVERVSRGFSAQMILYDDGKVMRATLLSMPAGYHVKKIMCKYTSTQVGVYQLHPHGMAWHHLSPWQNVPADSLAAQDRHAKNDASGSKASLSALDLNAGMAQCGISTYHLSSTSGVCGLLDDDSLLKEPSPLPNRRPGPIGFVAR